jgi:hypothetical protein
MWCPSFMVCEKLRWKRRGMGKRGGYRVIYYFHDERVPSYLMSAYAKSVQADLTSAEKRSLARQVKDLRSRARRR